MNLKDEKTNVIEMLEEIEEKEKRKQEFIEKGMTELVNWYIERNKNKEKINE